MLSILVIGWSIGFNGVRVGVEAAPYAPAMFVFGDSLADAGNNNFIPGCTVRANFTPYGISFFPRPTGRFTNGRTVFDFVEKGDDEAKNYIAKSLFCISIGGNDIDEFFTNNTLPNTNATQLITLLVNKYDRYLTGLYNVGARKILVADISAVGCTPYARNYGFIGYHGLCVEIVNQLVVEYNSALKQLVDRLNQNLDGISIILLKSYHYIMKMIKHGEVY
ncbi:hypothetical protein KI387_027774, partial [Taxus chinensis]